MLTIKEIFDICKEHEVFVDLSYQNMYYDTRCYMIKLYYGKKRYYRILDPLEFEYIFADRQSFDKYVSDFLDEVKKKGGSNDI